MQNSYARALEILGKPLDDRAYLDFVSGCGEEPEVAVHHSSGGQTVFFRKLGFTLTYYGHTSCYAQFAFHFATEMVSAGGVSPYSGEVQSGVNQGDSRDDVKRKIGCAPTESKLVQGRTPEHPKDTWDTYDFSPFELTFIFRGDTGHLGLASTRWMPACK